MSITRTVVLAVAGLLLSGCAATSAIADEGWVPEPDDVGTAVPAPTQDEDVEGYLTALREFADVWGYDVIDEFPEDDLVATGRQACGALALGQSREAVKDALWTNSPEALGEGDAMSIVYAAEDYLCPSA